MQKENKKRKLYRIYCRSERKFLQCSLLSLSKFRAPGSSHSWSCCCVPASSGVSHLPALCLPFRNSPVCILPLFNLIHLVPSANAALPLYSRLQTSYRPSTHFVYRPSAPSPLLHVFGSSLIGLPSASSFSSFRVLQWNTGGLRARSAKLLYISLYLVDLTSIQESNLISFSFFRIPGYSALRFDCTHSRSGVLSPDDPQANGGVVIFVRQSLSFSELYISSLSLLNLYLM